MAKDKAPPSDSQHSPNGNTDGSLEDRLRILEQSRAEERLVTSQLRQEFETFRTSFSKQLDDIRATLNQSATGIHAAADNTPNLDMIKFSPLVDYEESYQATQGKQQQPQNRPPYDLLQMVPPDPFEYVVSEHGAQQQQLQTAEPAPKRKRKSVRFTNPGNDSHDEARDASTPSIARSHSAGPVPKRNKKSMRLTDRALKVLDQTLDRITPSVARSESPDPLASGLLARSAATNAKTSTSSAATSITQPTKTQRKRRQSRSARTENKGALQMFKSGQLKKDDNEDSDVETAALVPAIAHGASVPLQKSPEVSVAISEQTSFDDGDTIVVATRTSGRYRKPKDHGDVVAHGWPQPKKAKG